ncbi:Beta-glucosidase BglX [Sulfidibacter corallicola]|uniref:beta-glucosidase n=1 Tax=Sulfidibacter corallicola TaxID=2818388 RepID=A0A8A4TME0_SULCO|nr:beta-glucosidase BglX [Sulfidibacter corallicola]QTD50051.1 beta-glucosidase BglX [Sulfidibacter corallicola]
MKTTIALLLFFVFPIAPHVRAGNPGGDAMRVETLLKNMTLEEKIGQLNQYSNTFDVTGPAQTEAADRQRLQRVRDGLVGSLLNVCGAEETRKAQRLAVEHSRLGIPMLFAFDVIHGYRTMFPIPLGEAASWDLAAIELSARIAATEAAAAGLHWTFAPMVDVTRDARWGRVMEGAGEDPYLHAVIAAARVRGFQGEDLEATDTVAACAKHFAAYGFAEAGRDYNTVDISEHTLRNAVLPPFQAAVEAGVATVMNSFNDIDGVPTTASELLQRGILKGEWGFQGFVISDWNSIGELVPHGVAVDLRQAALLAMTAGSDMDMESSAYVNHLVDLVRSGVVPEALIDDAVRRVLTLKSRLGLFEDPYRYCDAQREKKLLFSPKHRAAARDVARKSIVLLENRNHLLPLDKTKGSIAVIGPLAADKDVPLGNWRAKAIAGSAVSLLEGIQAAVGDGVAVRHAQGAPLGLGPGNFMNEMVLNHGDRSGFAQAIEAARQAETVVMAIGEEAFQTGEGRSQVDIRLKGVQMDLLKAVLEVNPRVVVVLMNGRPLVLDWMADKVPAIVEAWHLGSEAGHAIADVLFGDYNPSGKLPMSFPRHVGQLPLYYNHKKTGRPDPLPDDMVFWSHYTDERNTPRYPFGYGLSYTTFSYSQVTVSAAEIGFADELRVHTTVTNTGARAGTEIVQLYVRDLVGSVTRPVRELKGFQKVRLAPGASRKVTFTLDAKALAFYTRGKKWQAEPGEFLVFVGPNSRDLREARFTLREPHGPKPGK